MKRFVIVIAMILAFAMCAFAAQYHSVPIGHEAYRIIEVAVIRGAIPPQTDVKPYNVNVVKNLLSEIMSSDSFSPSEKNQVNRVLEDLDSLYGKTETLDFSDIFKRGYFRTNLPNTVSIGGNAKFDFIVGRTTNDSNVLDVRTGIKAYITGDLFDFMSYDLNFLVNVDKIDTKARLLTDLQIFCDGFYSNPFNAEDGSERLTKLVADGNGFNYGIENFSEISLSFKDDMFSARFGTLKRDWGPGYNNLALSGAARAFEGIEMSIKPSSWFNYSVSVGSLGYVSLESVNGVEWPSEDMEHKTGKYSNNISIHRVELGPLSGFKFAIWESVIWRKRFELSYLNPFTIYMFAQNALGDYDNVLAGFDASFTLKGIGQFYAAFSMDELNNAKILSNPRNIVAYQVGAKFNPRILDFSELIVQATYVTAFFGSHYEKSDAKLFANMPYTTAYVNKGQNIGYPINPDTLEILTSFKTSFGKGWLLDVVVKDQMRSAQYSYKTTGTDTLTPMNYEAYYAGDCGRAYGRYYKRDFFANIWNNAVDLEVSVSKKLESFPVTFHFGLISIWDMTRTFTPENEIYAERLFNPGKVDFSSDWQSTLTVSAEFGARVYY